MAKERIPFVEALEAEALEELATIRQYRTYQGTNSDYRGRAKIAIAVIGAYVRLRATMANERTNELVERRLLGSGSDVPSMPKRPMLTEKSA